MPPPQASYVSRSSDKGGYDPATLSDDEDDDAASVTSRSTWASSSGAEGGETTILGLTDGRISSSKADELSDWKISRVGGLPSFPLTVAPSASASLCLSCSQPMPLLTQVYCPLPTSTLERVLYVFSCPRPSCRRKEGAIRAWRANGLWAEGAAEEARQAEEDARRRREERERDEARKRAQAIDLGGLVFGGGGGGGAGTTASPFGTTPPPATASSSSSSANASASNPFALPSSSSSSKPSAAPNPFAPAPASAASPAFNPFAAPAPAANPFAAPPPPAAAAAAAAPPPPTSMSASASADAPAVAITSTWAPSGDALPLPAYPAWYISTMYEPAGASASPSSSSKGKGRARDAELAALAGGMTLSSSSAGPVAAEEVDGEDDGEEEEEEERARPGKGAGGRTRKGAAGGQGRKDGSGRVKRSVAAGTGAGAGGGGGGWEGEGYEVQKVKGVDEVFLRFQERVQREGRQVVRYEFGAHPLPYTASSAAYRLAFPPASSSSSSAAASQQASASQGSAGVSPGVGAYAPSRLPRCGSCGGATAFEAQLMPHLVGLVNGASSSEGQQDWATVWVLSCVDECEGGAGPGGGEGESWREERVLAEWEEEAV